MKHVFVFLLGTTLLAGTAFSATNLINFDVPADGTMINNYYPGVTFTNPIGGNVLVKNGSGFAPSAPNVVTITNGGVRPFFDSRYGAVDAHFSTLQRTISIDVRPVGPVDGNLTPLTKRPYLQALDSAGNYLGVTVYYSGPLPTNCCYDVGPVETLSITMPAGNIGIARFSSQGTPTNTSPTYGMFDNLRTDDGYYSLTVNTVGSGTVSISPFPGPYAYGTVVTLGATPSAGWTFNGWTGASNSASASIQIAMTADKALTANFVPTPQTGPNYIVTTINDHDDGVAGVLDCTLREAIRAANANSDSNTITFAAGVTGESILTLGEMAITHDLAIIGPGANSLAINGNAAGRVLNVQAGSVLVTGLTIRNGSFTGSSGATGASGGGTGGTGANGLGGCIFNQGTLTVSNCWVKDGFVQGGAGGQGGPDTFDVQAGMGGQGGMGAGGGIYNSGTLTVLNSTLSANNATGGTGGAGGDGYAYFYGDGSQAGNGGSGLGGGLANAGVLIIRNTTFSGDSATGGTGGKGGHSAPSQGDGGYGGNGGVGSGGGLANLQNLTMASCTVSSNSVFAGAGGAGGAGSGADGGPGGAGSASAGGLHSTTTLDIVQNTIVAANNVPDCAGTFTSQGYNLIGKVDGATGFAGTGDQTGTSGSPLLPLLGPLQLNGGTVPTMALLTGSPAIDRGKSAGLLTDERASLRPYDFPAIANAAGGDGSDIGAFELITPTLTISRSGTSSVVLSWGSYDTGYTLETESALSSPPTWAVAPGTAFLVGSQYRQTNSIATPGKQFFRLRK